MHFRFPTNNKKKSSKEFIRENDSRTWTSVVQIIASNTSASR